MASLARPGSRQPAWEPASPPPPPFLFLIRRQGGLSGQGTGVPFLDGAWILVY